MAVRFGTLLRNTILNNIISSLGASAAQLKIYTGTQPASAEDAATGTLLVTITTIGWNAAAGGSADITGTKTGTAVATGTAGWARLSNTGDTQRIDGSVGTTGTDFIIDNTSISSGGVVALTSALLTQAAS